MNLYPHFRILKRSRLRHACTLEFSHNDLHKAWTVPHGPPLHPHARHLAIEQTDGLPVATPSVTECWDAGPAEVRKWTPRHIVVVLHGAKLRGCFSFIRFRNAGRPQWLWVRVTPRARAPQRSAALASFSP